MFILNNFKEAKIVPNEDGTLKVEFNGVKFKNQNEYLEGDVIYPRVKIDYSTTLDVFSSHKQIDVEILPDKKDELYSIYLPEET